MYIQRLFSGQSGILFCPGIRNISFGGRKWERDKIMARSFQVTSGNLVESLKTLKIVYNHFSIMGHMIIFVSIWLNLRDITVIGNLETLKIVYNHFSIMGQMIIFASIWLNLHDITVIGNSRIPFFLSYTFLPYPEGNNPKKRQQ